MIVGDYCIVDAGAHIFSIFICFRECYSKMLSANVDMNFCPCEAEPREIMLRRKQTLHLHNINAAAKSISTDYARLGRKLLQFLHKHTTYSVQHYIRAHLTRYFQNYFAI